MGWLTVIKKGPMCGCEKEHWKKDERGAIPYGNGSEEQKRGRRGNRSVSSPLGEDEEGLTVVDRGSRRERGQSTGRRAGGGK